MHRSTVSESDLLAVLNSTPVIHGVHVDHLDDPDHAAAITEPFAGIAPSPSQLAKLRRARDAVQAVVRSEAPPTVLNPFLEGVGSTPSVVDGRVHWEIDGPASDLPAARLVLAWNEIDQAMPDRLRACANSECTKFLIDHSRPNTARWCSMATCGNLMKARRHQARRATDHG